jgi:hypothetical protein
MLSEFRKARIRTGKRLLVPASAVLLSFRPEGPPVVRPGRKAGIGIAERPSAEGAAQNSRDSITCAGPSGLPFDRALTPR